uniref:Uncharacterized protein n=1 Tax=Cacopsylla melanoneura TaxID=428564 RepID=A0A8D9FJB7_9HEMI
MSFRIYYKLNTYSNFELSAFSSNASVVFRKEVWQLRKDKLQTFLLILLAVTLEALLVLKGCFHRLIPYTFRLDSFHQVFGCHLQTWRSQPRSKRPPVMQ